MEPNFYGPEGQPMKIEKIDGVWRVTAIINGAKKISKTSYSSYKEASDTLIANSTVRK